MIPVNILWKLYNYIKKGRKKQKKTPVTDGSMAVIGGIKFSQILMEALPIFFAVTLHSMLHNRKFELHFNTLRKPATTIG